MIGLPDFLVFHSHGVEGIRAETAAQAVARSSAPLGVRDVRAVVSARMVICNDNANTTGPFTAILGTAPTWKGEPAR